MFRICENFVIDKNLKRKKNLKIKRSELVETE